MSHVDVARCTSTSHVARCTWHDAHRAPPQDHHSLPRRAGADARAVSPIDRTERVPLGDAGGRVLAEAIVADADVPPFDRAAMDGFAVRAEDTAGAGGTTPKVAALCRHHLHGLIAGARDRHRRMRRDRHRRAGAGGRQRGRDGRGDGQGRRVAAAAGRADHEGGHARPERRRRGADIARGDALLAPGDLLTPSRIGCLRRGGPAEVVVYARPVVAIVSTGNEIVEPGQPLGPAQIYDINRFTLSAVGRAATAAGRGCFASAPDDLPALTAMLVEATRSADIVVFSGGSSVGERDLVLDAMRQAGEVIFHGIAVKPGKPTALGRVGGTPVLGMPGNPTSCLSNAYLLLVPDAAAHGAPAGPSAATPIACRWPAASSRPLDATSSTLCGSSDGAAVPAFKSSGDITSMSRADGYIEMPAQTESSRQGRPLK